MKRLSKNFIAILVSDVGRRFLGFLVLAYLTRKISIADFGAVNVGLTVLSYGLMASSGGLSSFGTREIVRDDNPGLVSGILSSRLLNACAVYAVVALIAFFLITNAETRILTALFSVSLMINAMYLDWYFQGKESMGIIGTARLTAAVVYLLMILVMVQSSADLIWIPVAAVAGDLAVAAILAVTYRRYHPGRQFSFIPSAWPGMMKKAFPIGAGSIFAHFSINLPPLILGIILTNAEVGLYSAASKMVFFLLMLDRVMTTLLLPASTRYYAESRDALARVLATAVKWIVVLAFPVLVGGSILADRIIPFVFGSQYIPAATCFRVLIWYFFFTLIHTIFSTGLVAIDQEKLFSRLMAVSAAFYAVTVTGGTYFFGVTGAAAGVVFSEAVTVILMRHRFVQFVPVRLASSLLRSVLAGVIMGAVVLLLPQFPLLVLIATGAVVYVFLVYLLRVITAAELMELVRRA